jgi:hypothetical protein
MPPNRVTALERGCPEDGILLIFPKQLKIGF